MTKILQFAVKPRPTKDGFNLSSDSLPWPMWYGTTDDAVHYAISFRAGSEPAVVTIFNNQDRVIETINHSGDARRNADTLGGM